MKEYRMNVFFEKGEIGTDLYDLVQYDYNSAKIIFTFDKEGTKEFKILFPDKTYYIDEIQNDEIILKEGLLNQVGEYEIEISIYNENSKLTEYATHKFKVRQLLIDGSEEAEIDDRLPILDKLINETDNLNVEVSKEENVTTIEVTKKDGTKKSVEILDGARGEKGEPGERGETGAPGTDGRDGVDGADGFSPIVNVVKKNNVTRISVVDKYGETSSEIKDGIDNTVNNLINYYLKSETYTKSEVQELISAIKGMQIEVVEELPETGESNKIYLVAKEGTEKDIYNEYIWINNAYELIGNTEIDLTNYYTKEEIDELFKNASGVKYITNNTIVFDKLDIGYYISSNNGEFDLSVKATETSPAKTTYYRGCNKFYVTKNYNDAEVNEYFAVGYGFNSRNGEFTVNFYKTNDNYGINYTINGYTTITTLNTNQTITGKKTFTTLPESDIVPTNDNQFVNKKYVDDNAGGNSNNLKIFPIYYNNNFSYFSRITDEASLQVVSDFLNYCKENNGNAMLSIRFTDDLQLFRLTTNVSSSVTYLYGLKEKVSGGLLKVPRLVVEKTTIDGEYKATQIIKYMDNSNYAYPSNYLAKDNTTAYTPTSDYNPAPKKYVDDAIASAITTTLGGEF